LVSCQPSPTPTVFLYVGDRLGEWVFPTSQKALLAPGITYTLGYVSSTSNGYFACNITFTTLSTCPQFPTNNAAYVSTYGAPSNNVGWRFVLTSSPTNSYNGMTIYESPSEFGSSINGWPTANKYSWTFDLFDACNCLVVNYLSFTTADNPSTLSSTGQPHAFHYWSSFVHKKRQNQCPCECASMTGFDCPCGGTSWVLCPSTHSSAAPAYAHAFNPSLPGDKRQNTNYYTYWAPMQDQPCMGNFPSVGVYGNGINTEIQYSSALAITYA